MEETILFPSPNWFQASCLAVSRDGWLIYGGPSKSLCALEPLPADHDGFLLGKHNFKAHVLNRAHPDKIVCVAISPDWPEKRDVLAGSADGLVKQWTLEQVDNKWKLKGTQSHDKHQHDKEEVVGVAYSHDSYAVTVGTYGNLVKWDIKSNVVKMFRNLKGFRPSCLSCSPHIPLNIAVGTKQGVVFVIDLTGSGKTLYKVRGQDEEITNVSWCPQYEVLVKKALGENENQENMVAPKRMMKIRQVTDEEKLQFSEGEKEQEPIDANEGNKETEVKNENAEVLNQKTEDNANVLEDSGIVKNLPEDSFDETVVPDDDMFDIYKDHEADEFGHKKYQPEDIVIKVKEEAKPDDYLAECLKLKEEILKRKNQQEQTMEALVNAFDEAHLDKTNVPSTSDTQISNKQLKPEEDSTVVIVKEARGNYSVHVHKHLLATVSKFGSVRIWSKSGKLVASCAVPQQQHNKNVRMKSPSWATILWFKSDVLLIADGKNQLLECSPLNIDNRNRLSWNVVHTFHKRGLFSIATDAPRVQSADQSFDEFTVWTTGQDRNIVCYSLAKKEKLAMFATCGGFIYNIQACPYGAGKIAASVGDGAVRVWETDISADGKLSRGRVAMHWQHVQGKVLCVAWHPHAENLVAFSTAESRVGLIDTSAKVENRTRNLISGLTGPVYSLCWGDDNDLYACGGGVLVKYNTKNVDEAPTPIAVTWEGKQWELSAVSGGAGVGSGSGAGARALLAGGCAGAVAVLARDPPHAPRAATHVFSKMIHTMDWHPQQTSSSSEDSPLKNLIAVCSLDKLNTVVILEYVEKDDGSAQLTTWKTLSGHKGVVHQVAWSPHSDGLLLSTSQDTTVRVWDAVSGTNTHTFPGHAGGAALAALWSSYPQLRRAVLSGGGDCCLRLWRLDGYPNTGHIDLTQEPAKKKKHKRTGHKTEEAVEQEEEVNVATQESKLKASKRFLLPVLTRQMAPCSIQGVRKMLQKYLEKKNGDNPTAPAEDMEQSYNVNYIKIFGSIKEVNELLDEELERHVDTGNFEAWAMLSLFRGRVDDVMRSAAARDLLCPFLLSLAPCVSLKYWKDVCQLYLEQIDRLVAKGEEHKLAVGRAYGGARVRAASVRLSAHDVRGAVRVLADAKLYKEAYVLCRTRYMDSIAEDVLKQWAEDCFNVGSFNTAAVCHVALGNLSEAANILSRSKDENWLSLATEMAKIVGQNTFADHIAEKREQIKNNAPSDIVEEIESLPSRIELLMKDSAVKDTKEEGQGDVNDDRTNDGSIEHNISKEGQGDIECRAESNPIKDYNLPKEEKGEILVGTLADAKESDGERVAVLNSNRGDAVK